MIVINSKSLLYRNYAKKYCTYSSHNLTNIHVFGNFSNVLQLKFYFNYHLLTVIYFGKKKKLPIVYQI